MISREAADKQKGFRLQKIRAIVLMLDVIEQSSVKPHVYSATEHFEDVYLHNATPGYEQEIFEEDKNYDPTTSFTFNNPILRNSLVSFIDIWFKKGYGISKNIYFSFYSTNSLGKERQSNWTRDLGISLPDKALIESIKQEEWRDEVIEAIKKYMVEEYRCQYQDKDTNGYLASLQAWTNQDWISFLSRIDWSFGQLDEKDLKEEALEKIKNCKLFSAVCEGYENHIFNSLMETFDSRQHIEDPLERYVHVSDVKEVFQDIQIKALSNGRSQKQRDNVWKMWEELPEPYDKRALSDKIHDRCPTFSKKAIGILAKKVTRSYIETQSIKGDKDFLSYRYRIYEECIDRLYEIISQHPDNEEVTESLIHEWVKTLKDSACGKIEELSKDFHYKHTNTVMIEGVILELFDNCFLSFDHA